MTVQCQGFNLKVVTMRAEGCVRKLQDSFVHRVFSQFNS